MEFSFLMNLYYIKVHELVTTYYSLIDLHFKHQGAGEGTGDVAL